MELTFLGSGNAFASGGRYWSSFLANRRYLFDAPPTLLPHLKQLKVPLAGLEVVFITHFHGDHFVGMPFLFLEYVYMTERTEALHIVGPPGIAKKLEDFARSCYPEITNKVAYERHYIDASPEREQTAGGISFQAVPMNHVVGKLECFGYRANIDGKTVAYTGDTMFCEEIFELAKGADVLVVDCTYSQGSGPEHMGLADVKTIRERLPAETAIILTHLNGKPDLQGLENVIAAEDLATYRF